MLSSLRAYRKKLESQSHRIATVGMDSPPPVAITRLEFRSKNGRADISGQFDGLGGTASAGPRTGSDPAFDRWWKATQEYCQHLIDEGAL